MLEVLSTLAPPWTLTGGAALAAVHLQHRTTRDLDLFWHGRDALDHLGREAQQALTRNDLEVEVIQTGSTFQRLRVSKEDDVVVVDLVADPVATVEDPQAVELGSVRILVDTAHEILVNKLCALVSRSEVRDLVDLRQLLEAGGNLERGMEDAPSKDGGFSPLTLVWTLKQLSLVSPDVEEGLASGLEDFRVSLIERLARGSAPG